MVTSLCKMRRQPLVALSILSVLLVIAILIATSLGAVSIPVENIAAIVLKHTLGFSTNALWDVAQESIVWELRLPRVLGAAFVGAALAAAGVLFQGLLRNPMADPYLLGTSGGAALAATVALLLPLSAGVVGFTLVPGAAFVGALGAVFLVYQVARVGARTPITTLLLSGFAVSSMMAAMMSFLMLLNQNTLTRVVLWTMGSINATSWQSLQTVAIMIALGFMAAYVLASDLNAFLLGEEQAAALGVAVERQKFFALIVGALLTGTAVAISGLVGFVGLIVPHVVRLLFGPDHRLLLPASFLSGAIFLVVADLIARTILAPSELPLGVVTAVIGSPFFIYLLRRSKRDYTF